MSLPARTLGSGNQSAQATKVTRRLATAEGMAKVLTD